MSDRLVNRLIVVCLFIIAMAACMVLPSKPARADVWQCWWNGPQTYGGCWKAIGLYVWNGFNDATPDPQSNKGANSPWRSVGERSAPKPVGPDTAPPAPGVSNDNN